MGLIQSKSLHCRAWASLMKKFNLWTAVSVHACEFQLTSSDGLLSRFWAHLVTPNNYVSQSLVIITLLYISKGPVSQVEP